MSGPATARYLAAAGAHVTVTRDTASDALFKVECEACGYVSTERAGGYPDAAQAHAGTCRRIPERLWPEGAPAVTAFRIGARVTVAYDTRGDAFTGTVANAWPAGSGMTYLVRLDDFTGHPGVIATADEMSAADDAEGGV
jgi:hypothetical protein